VLGSILIADHLRPEATESIAALKDMGMRTTLITGDAKAVAYEMAKALKVDRVYAELLPSQKADCVEKFTRKGCKIAMVGDGINDAPALVKADVGVAMGSGTDVARETGDVILIGNDLSKFVETLRIARKCRSIIFQNFYGTLIVDGVGVLMAAFGLLTRCLPRSFTFHQNSLSLQTLRGCCLRAGENDFVASGCWSWPASPQITAQNLDQFFSFSLHLGTVR
jgi:P-type E1-E2 ATPase